MKKSALFVGMFILTLVFSSFVFSCDSSQVIFSLYSETNSHVGSYDNSDYTVKACYNETFGVLGDGSRECEGKDVIFYKASLENSHVSLTSDQAYNIPVCYGDLVCENRTNCLDGEEVLARISSATNAHLSLGDSDLNYPIKICCKKGSPDYISSVNSAKWIDSFSGDEVSEVSNGTKVNISFEGEFQEGEIFDYKIYVKKENFLGLVQSNVLIYSGSGVIETAGFFSSIYFNAIWNESFLIDGKSVYIFKIFGKNGAELKESGELLVNKTGGLNPTITKISSPKDGEIYFEGDKIYLNWSLVSGDKIVKNLTYYSPGANINGTGRDVFSILGSHDDLINLPLYLNYSTSGQKEIILTTVDSTGKSHTSRVLISVAGEGINIFALINKPRNEEKVFVEGISNHLVRFNSSESFVYNSSNGQLTCLAGKCPEKTSGNPSKNINSSSLNDNEKALRVQELYFNWTWRESTVSVYGNGTSSSIVSFQKGCAYGNDVVSLNLSYKGVSQKVSNDYTVFYNGDYCLNNILFSDPNKCFSQVTGDCCNEGYKCSDTENVCKLIIDDALFCSNFTSKNSCEASSPNKLPYANRSFNGMCGVAQYNGNGACYMVFEDCTCVWNSSSSKCEAVSTPKNYNCQKLNGGGTCNIFTTLDGSCSNSGGIVTYNNIANWVWTTTNGDIDDPRKVACEKMNGTNTMACPVQVRLSFFGVIEFVVAIILIALIYFVIRDLFSKRKVSEEKIKTKKVLKKKVTKKKK